MTKSRRPNLWAFPTKPGSLPLQLIQSAAMHQSPRPLQSELDEGMALSPIERIRLDKAAVDEGFGLKRPDHGDWLAYDSLGAPASIRLTCAEGNYLVAINHPGVISDLSERWEKWPDGNEPCAQAGFTAFVVSDTAPLHHLVREIWRLARALPVEP